MTDRLQVLSLSCSCVHVNKGISLSVVQLCAAGITSHSVSYSEHGAPTVHVFRLDASLMFMPQADLPLYVL